eukprot:scaffold185538_cov17-Tisochrysis_lutea.AAC.2
MPRLMQRGQRRMTSSLLPASGPPEGDNYSWKEDEDVEDDREEVEDEEDKNIANRLPLRAQTEASAAHN